MINIFCWRLRAAIKKKDDAYMRGSGLENIYFTRSTTKISESIRNTKTGYKESTLQN